MRWTSTGEADFSVETIEKTDRGTTIILHLRDDALEFADHFRISSLIKKYSDHIGVPILMEKLPEESEPEADDDKDKKTPVAEEKKDKEAPQWEAVNDATALWTRSRSEVKDEEYKEFYKHVSHDFEDPMQWSHNKVEGKLEYTSLLYIPKRPPFDLWNREQTRGLKLYVQRIFIMDDAEQFLPLYLRFIKGIVDSNDLSLNVSREILQQDPTIAAMKTALTKRVLNMLDKMAKNDSENYQLFWDNFGQVLKEGPAEDASNKEAIAKLLRFASTKDNTDKQHRSLDDYIASMQKEQDKIYYITAENFTTGSNSPHLEVFRKKDIEVLILYDRIDEWLMSHLMEYDDKSLADISRGNLDLGKLDSEEDKKAQEKLETENKDLTERVNKVLGEKVQEVRVTNRLTESPACIVINETDMGAQMRRMMEQAGQAMPPSKPIFELNPQHPLVDKLDNEADEDRFADLVNILFDQSNLAEGGQLEDPAAYVHRLNKLLLE